MFSTKRISQASLVAIIMGSTLLAGCQHAQMGYLTAPVIPQADSSYETYGQGSSKNAALADAMHNSTTTCKRSNEKLRPVVLSKEVKYDGLVNEKTDAMISKVGSVLGSVIGKKVPTTKTKTDYKVTMNFKCVE